MYLFQIVFNPNKTVVKMFVVLYDCSDMPPKSQTFLRQKTYSALKGNVVKNEVMMMMNDKNDDDDDYYFSDDDDE